MASKKLDFKNAIANVGTKAAPAAAGGVSAIVMSKFIPSSMKDNYRKALPLVVGTLAVVMSKSPAIQFAGAGLVGKAVGDMAETWGIGAPKTYAIPQRHKELFYRVKRQTPVNSPDETIQTFTMNQSPNRVNYNYNVNGVPGMVTDDMAYGGMQN